MSGEGREFAVNLAFSLVLHFLVFAGVFLTPSLYTQPFRVPGPYKVTLVELPRSGRVTAPREKARAIQARPPKASARVTPSPPPPKVKGSPAKPEVTPASPETLALPKKQRKVRRPPRGREPAATRSSAAPPTVAQAPLPAALPAGPESGPPGVVAESSVSTEKADPSLSYYLAAVQAKVSSRWVEPSVVLTPGQAKRVTVGFTVLRSGLVRDIQVLTASQSIFLDQSALRAVQESVPLPPFPPLFAEETLRVRFHFELRGE